MKTKMKTIASEEVVTAINGENKVNNQLNPTNFEFIVVDNGDVDLSNDKYLYELFANVAERYLENNLSGLSLNFLYKGERNTITLYRYGIKPEEVKYDFDVKPSEHTDKLYKFFKHAFARVIYISEHLYSSLVNSDDNYIKANNTDEALKIIADYVVNNINEADIKVVVMQEKQRCA